MPARRRAGRVALMLACAAAAWAAVTAISGGFVLAGLHLSSRDPIRPVGLALILIAFARAMLDAEFQLAVRPLIGSNRGEMATRIALAAAACVLIVAIAWNTRAAGGSDSSCYALQADAFAHGRATLVPPLPGVLPDAPPAVFAPTGFIPSPRAAHDAVPICGPGLALAMAPAFAITRDAVFLVVPLFAALAVWLTFLFGRTIDDEVTGAAAAVLLAS